MIFATKNNASLLHWLKTDTCVLFCFWVFLSDFTCFIYWLMILVCFFMMLTLECSGQLLINILSFYFESSLAKFLISKKILLWYNRQCSTSQEHQIALSKFFKAILFSIIIVPTIINGHSRISKVKSSKSKNTLLHFLFHNCMLWSYV